MPPHVDFLAVLSSASRPNGEAENRLWRCFQWGIEVDISLQQLFRVARRWWWLLLLVSCLAGLTAYLTSSRQQPLYSASTVVEVNPSQSASIDWNALEGSKTLAGTYLQLITTRTVLEPLVADLDLSYGVDTLQDNVTASTVGDTQLVRISVSDPDPETAAAIANAVAQRFVAYITDRAEQLTGPYRSVLDQQIGDTAAQITAAQGQIRQLEQQQITAEQQDELSSLRANLAQLQQTYRELVVAANEMVLAAAGAQTRVTVAEVAVPPTTPYAPQITFYTLLGVFAGLCLATAGTALLEYLDNTVKAEQDFVALVGAPQLSAIDAMSHLGAGVDQLFVLYQPQSRPAEEIRLLRTNIAFAAASGEIASLVVTSAGPGEGKSTIIANLAVAMAQAGFSTVVVDADLRRPSQHRIFKLPTNERGLTTLLLRQEETWQWAATNVPGIPLAVIPSGPLPPNPGDLLNGRRFHELIRRLSDEADIVLIDTAPVLAVSDPLIVSSLVDGVLLVCQADRTRIDALRQVAAAFPRETSRLVGVVVNRQRGSKGVGYYEYYTEGSPSDTDRRTSREAPRNRIPTPGTHSEA